MWKTFELGHVNDVARRDSLAQFKVDKLPTLRVGEQIKQARELMRRALFWTMFNRTSIRVLILYIVP
jgi:hypothetical protein